MTTTRTQEADLNWLITEDMPPPPYPRDSQFIFKRIPEVLTQIAIRDRPQRVLEVACGIGKQLELLRPGTVEVWGLDASPALTRYCNERFAGDPGAGFVTAVAERLPFEDDTFDCVLCQGSLDHFPRPRAFLRDVARILKPDGRAVIALSNFDSLACRLGRTLYRAKAARGMDVYRGRNYWEIPENHTFRGTYSVLLRIGEPHLELVECRGISLLWLFHRWSRLMDALPPALAWSTMTVADRIAYRVPALADMVVSVWQPRKAGHVG